MFEMQRYSRILMILAFAIGTFVIGMIPDADAAFVLTIDDLGVGAAGTEEVIVVDDVFAAGIGVVNTAKGLVTHADIFVGLGTISFSGALSGGSVFTVNVTTGVSKPTIGPGKIDLVSVNISGAGAGVLEIMLTDTGFIAPNPQGISDSIGGLTDGTITAEGFFGPGNVEFEMTVATPILAFGPGAFSGVSSVAIPLAQQLIPFSLTKNVVITHTGAGQLTSFNNQLEVIPEPSTYLLFAVGILSIIGASYRRRKKA